MDEEKKKLVELIDKKHSVEALVQYMNKYKTEHEDVEYLLDAFRIIERGYMSPKHEKFNLFYSEYIRMLTIGLKKEVLRINPENKEKVEKVILIATNKAINSAPFLYAARFYRLMYENHVEEYMEQKDAAIMYYTKAESYGNTNAIVEKEAFLDIIKKHEREQREREEERKEREKYRVWNLDYYNSEYDLTDLIGKVLKEENDNFAMLLYGPENSGMKEFACKLLVCADKNYISVNAAKLQNRYDIEKDIDCSMDTYNAFILHNVNSCFYKYNRFEDDKDFILEKNTQYLVNQIRRKQKSFILIVDDINKLTQTLLDAFPFKIRFDYMNKKQKRLALKNIFNVQSNMLDDVNGLVYQDFLRTKKQVNVLDVCDENEIIELLKKEANSKPNFLTYSAPALQFDINLVNTDIDLVKITAKLEKTTLPFTMLISGPAGTGKSYYLRYLAHKMGRDVIEKTAAELFSTYQGEPARNVLKLFKEAEEQNAIIILDEVEKITSSRNRGTEANAWRSDMTNAFLTCLENAKSPFMATTNFIADIDKAILRRFVFKFKFDYLKSEQIAYAFKYAFDKQAPTELFKIGGLTSGDFAVVKKRAQILDVLDDAQELYEMLKEEATIKAVGHVVHIEKEINYDRNFINIDGNSLDLYVKKIKEEQISNFSILLYGPSGTGKSLYLRHLAQELGYEIIERRASDIISMWVGETEKNIAEAFEEAKNRRAMIIFDEIDSFIPNKGNLVQAHDTRVVNEFLVQLESHPYPVCATTNYLDQLERASVRRFKIDAKFDYLRQDQYGYVYRKTFGFEPPEDINRFTKLTPAIFTLAAEKVGLENVGTDGKSVFEIFAEEVKRCSGENIICEEDKTYENLTIKSLRLYKTPIADNYDKILSGFVKIITNTGHGSGFFITKDGFILTNKHVVGEETIVKVELFSGRTVPGEVIRTNSLDVALVKISAENKVYPLPIQTKELNIGSTVFSFGNPGSKNQVLSKGCITRYTVNKDKDDAQRIETDCFMDNGASGGPLLDEFGNVIGVNVEGWLANAKIKINLGLNLHLAINDALEALNITVSSASSTK